MKWLDDLMGIKPIPKYETPEEYFSDCDGDVVKMADKFLLDVNIRTFSQLIYLQKKLIEEQRKCLTKHLS